MIHFRSTSTQSKPLRRGAASLDYVLTIAVLFVMSGFIVMNGRRIMQLVYELTGFFLAWPFM